MSHPESPLTLDRVVRVVVAVAAVLGTVWLLHYLREALIPFALALLLAYLLNPLVNAVQRKVPSRAGAVALSLLAMVVAGLSGVALVVPLVLRELRQAASLISALLSNSTLAQRAGERLPPDLWRAIRELVARPEVQELLTASNVVRAAEQLSSKVLPGVWGVLSGAMSLLAGLMAIVVVLLYLVFLLMDYQRVRQGWKELIPPLWRQGVLSFVRDFDAAMSRYFRAQALVSALTGVGFALGFALIGLPLGVLLGLFVGLLNMVPYLQIVALVPAALLAMIHALETGMSFGSMLALTGAVFAVVQIVQDAVLVPRIMGKVTGLSPAMILLSLSIWGKLLGMLGLLIALPVTCLLLAYYQRYLAAQAQQATATSTASPLVVEARDDVS